MLDHPVLRHGGALEFHRQLSGLSTCEANRRHRRAEGMEQRRRGSCRWRNPRGISNDVNRHRARAALHCPVSAADAERSAA